MIVRAQVPVWQVAQEGPNRISLRVRVRVSVSIVLGLATGGYSWIWPKKQMQEFTYRFVYHEREQLTVQSTIGMTVKSTENKMQKFAPAPSCQVNYTLVSD